MIGDQLQRFKAVRRIRAQFARFSRERSGAYVIMTAIALPAVVGSFGFMSEVATWYASKQFQQGAADSASISAALGIAAGETTTYVALARAVAGSNGYIHGMDTVTVDVNRPPLTGPSKGNNSAVEVIIRKVHPAQFSSVLNLSTQTVGARSVALIPSLGSCVLALSPNAGPAIRVQGNVSINASQCALVSNSTNPNSVVVGGNAKVTVQSINTAGKMTVNGNPTVNGTVSENTGALVDPYASLAIPAPAGTCTAFNASNPVPGTTYCSMDIGNSSVTLPAGTYIINGAFGIKNKGVLNGTGVTLVFGPNATFGIQGGNINITAPNAGTMKGIAITSSRSMPAGTQMKFTGQSNATITGVIYMPTVDLTFRGGSAPGGCIQIAARTVDFGGSSNLEMNCAAYGVKNPAGRIALSE